MSELIKDFVGLAFLTMIIIIPLVDHHQTRSGFNDWIYIR